VPSAVLSLPKRVKSPLTIRRWAARGQAATPVPERRPHGFPTENGNRSPSHHPEQVRILRLSHPGWCRLRSGWHIYPEIDSFATN
jgi:hypothetical protein